MDATLSAEVQKALGYAGGTALVIKLADLVIRWRSRDRVDTTAEIGLTLKMGAEIREELRKQLEEERLRADAAEEREEALGRALSASKIDLASARNEADDLRAELRLLRRDRLKALRDASAAS
jgi:hypothetical protein